MRIALCAMAGLAAACSAPRAAASLSAEARATSIDAHLSQLRRDTATVMGLSAEGASLEAAYDGTQLRRLRATYLGEVGRASDTFYYDSTVFLVVRQELHYDAPMSGKVIDSTEQRIDLTRTDLPSAKVDSLRAVARALLQQLHSR